MGCRSLCLCVLLCGCGEGAFLIALVQRFAPSFYDMEPGERFRMWSYVFILGGFLFWAGAVALFILSSLPWTGWIHLVCSFLFFGGAIYFQKMSNESF